MASSLILKSDDLVCELKPELGGCIAGLWLGDVPVLRSVHSNNLQSVRQSGSYPLVPYSNRLRHAILHWQGIDYQLLNNWEPSPHSIHGVGWERPWAVLEAADTSAHLSYTHNADSTWPFDFVTSQVFKLERGALSMNMRITNQSPVPVPVGLGWHPNFVKRPGSHIAFAATGRWEMGDDQLPTDLIHQTGLQTDTGALTIDHCFEGWDGVATLRDPWLQVRMQSSLTRLVVFTVPGREVIAIEPVSHVNNALSHKPPGGKSPQELGVVVVPPGQTYACSLLLEIQRTAPKAQMRHHHSAPK